MNLAPEHERIHGTIYPPTPKTDEDHKRCLLGVLTAFLQGGTESHWVAGNVPVEFSQHILVPDICAWHRFRGKHVDYSFLAKSSKEPTRVMPDWVCEIVSNRPDVRHLDRFTKFDIYEESGLKALWLIDPVMDSFEVYLRPNRKHAVLERRQVLRRRDGRVQVEPFGRVLLNLKTVMPLMP